MKRFALILMVFLLTACAAPQGEPVRIGWMGYPDSFNPGMGELQEAYSIYELVYDSMFEYNADGTYSNDFVRSYEISEDQKVWTFHLVDNAYFHDGQPVLAEDVAFSYNLYMTEEEFDYMIGYTQFFESVTAVGDHTLEIRLLEPIPNMESQLIYLFILPKHLWEPHMNDAAAYENIPMVGSGPFQYKSHQPGVSIELSAYPDHHSRPPKVAGVVFMTYENGDDMINALLDGTLDAVTSVPRTSYTLLEQNENISIVSGPPLYPSISDILINQIAPENCPEGQPCSGHPALRDRTVRLALAHATNKVDIINDVLYGLGRVGRTIMPDSLGRWYNIELEDYPYNPDISIRLLDQAGYLDTDDDGVREMPGGGQPLSFRLYYPDDTFNYPIMADLLTTSWERIGIDVQATAIPDSDMGSFCCPAYDYDLMLWGWGSDPDPSFLLSVMTTAGIADDLNETGYSNPEYDQLFTQQALELDPNRRRDLVWEMQRIAFRDVVYIIPYYEIAVQAYRTDRFTGWLIYEPTLALQHINSLLNIQAVP